MRVETLEVDSNTPGNIQAELAKLSAAALLVGAERLQAEQESGQAFDTTYDRFKWDYIGNPYADGSLPLRRVSPDGKEYVYDYPESRSYSDEGTLVLVRRATNAGVQDLRRFMVVTGDLVSRTIDEWYVAGMEHSGAGDNLRTVLRLSKRPYGSVPAGVEPESSRDILWNALRDKSIKLATMQERQRLPSLILDNHHGGNCFIGEDGTLQFLAPIQELVHQVDNFWDKIAPTLRQARQVSAPATAHNIAELFHRASGL